MTLFIRFKGLPEVERTLQGLPGHLEKQTILRLSQVAYDDAERGTQRHTKTGALRQSLYNRAVPTGRAVGHDGARAPHAVFVNMGTRAHTIRPNKKKSLRWVGAGGRFSFSKEVRHPGYRGDPYIINAADTALRQFAAIVDAALQGSP